MKQNRRFLALWLLLLSTSYLTACSEPASESRSGMRTQALNTNLGGGGLVRWPIAVGADGSPLKDPSAALQSGWNGTLAELLAADAFAQCAATTSDFHLTKAKSYATEADSAPIQGVDSYLNHLDTLINTTLSLPCYNSDTKESVERWLEFRSNPKCSADAITNEPRAQIELAPNERAIDHVARDVSAYETFNGDPFTWKPADNSWQITGSAVNSAQRAASRELSYADLNLCMAEHLRGFVNSTAVLAAPAADHRELLGVIRERAQLAATQYSMLASVFSTFPRNDVPEEHIVNDPNSFLILLYAWSHWAGAHSPQSLVRLGEDYARALRLTISATFEFQTILAREASASLNQGSSNEGGAYGVGSARVRSMNLLYGGDPLGDPTGTPRAGRGQGGTRADGKEPLHVSTDLSDPRLRLLFSLARSADALNFRVLPMGGIDPAPSSDRLYKSIETWLRQEDCSLTNPGGSACTKEALFAALPALDQSDSYLLWKRYQLRPADAKTFVMAFAEAFGELFTRDTALPNVLYVSLFHLLGAHGQTVINGESWFHVDPASRIVPLQGHELALAYERLHWLPAYYTIFGAYPQDQGFVATTPLFLATAADIQKWERLRALGAVPALVYARQALLMGAHPSAPSASAPFFDTAASALADVEAAVGTRSMTVQQNQYGQMNSSSCPYSGGATSCTRVLMFTHAPIVIEPVNDTHTTLVQVKKQRGILEIARDREFVPFLGNLSRADIETTNACYGVPPDGCSGPACVPCNTPPYNTVEFLRYGKGLSFNFIGTPWYGERATLLKGVEDGVTTYYPVFRNGLDQSSDEGLQVSFGGSLNRLAQDVWAPLAEDWSRPTNDALGVKSTWAPSTNAALLGGEPGEESYAFLLRRAKSAAEAAATSVQTALDQVVGTALARSSGETSAQQSSGTAEIELTGLCGGAASKAGEPCALDLAIYNAPSAPALLACDRALSLPDVAIQALKLENVSIPATPLNDAFPVGSSLQSIKAAVCTKLVNAVFSPGRGVLVLTAVANAGKEGPPATAAGSELGQLMVQQWNELSAFKEALNAAGDQAESLAVDVAASYRDIDVAFKELDIKRREVDRLLGCNPDPGSDCPCATDPTKCTATLLPYQTVLAGLKIDEAQLAKTKAEADAAQSQICGRAHRPEPTCPTPNSLAADNLAGRDTIDLGSYHGGAGIGSEFNLADLLPGTFGTRCTDRPMYIQNQWACEEAEAAVNNLGIGNPDPLKDPYTIIKNQRENLNAGLRLQVDDQLAQLAKAEKAYDLTRLNQSQVWQHANEAITDQIILIQSRMAQLLDSNNQFNQLRLRASQARARGQLESNVDAAKAQAKYGLDAAFRSYDLWRSEALLKDARTMALAARKAIESRFLVNLEKVVQPQAFVEAPALWANDVYTPDLGAPSAVGLQPLTPVPGAVYPNKLVDYVGNLERFVAGYPATHPSANVQQDLEVLTFPGPNSTPVGPTATPAVAAQPLYAPEGWFFYCPENGRWLSNPALRDAALRDTADAASATSKTPLTTLCDGKPPTQARLTFSLDPWGQSSGYFALAPYHQRYNTRWRRLAVNLVSSGIRDCQRATDPRDCGAAAFLRFSLTHTGPHWAVDFDRNWTELQLPSASIEGGKALATETFLNPVSMAFENSTVASAAREELMGRAVDGTYQLTLELTPDVRLDRIERLQVLTELEYWVREGAVANPPQP